jgi:hypothetical protein
MQRFHVNDVMVTSWCRLVSYACLDSNKLSQLTASMSALPVVSLKCVMLALVAAVSDLQGEETLQ